MLNFILLSDESTVCVCACVRDCAHVNENPSTGRRRLDLCVCALTQNRPHSFAFLLFSPIFTMIAATLTTRHGLEWWILEVVRGGRQRSHFPLPLTSSSETWNAETLPDAHQRAACRRRRRRRRFHPNRRSKSRTITFQSSILSLMLYSLIRFAAFSFFHFVSLFPISASSISTASPYTHTHTHSPHIARRSYTHKLTYTRAHIPMPKSNRITLMDIENGEWEEWIEDGDAENRKRRKKSRANRTARRSTMNENTHEPSALCSDSDDSHNNNKPKLIFAREHETNNCIKYTIRTHSNRIKSFLRLPFEHDGVGPVKVVTRHHHCRRLPQITYTHGVRVYASANHHQLLADWTLSCVIKLRRSLVSEHAQSIHDWASRPNRHWNQEKRC